MMRIARTCLMVAFATTLTGCINLAPKYTRNAAPVPQTWPTVNGTSASASAIPTAALGWRNFFKDVRLQHVIEQALANNRDLRVAVLNIEKARAQYRIQRADLFPSISASGSQTASRTPSRLTAQGESSVSRTDSVQLGFSSYQLDLFGELHNLKDAEWENYLSTAEARRSTQISLVASVANDWLTLASDMALLDLSRLTLKSQQASYELTKAQHDIGTVSGLDLVQAQSSVEAARKDIASYITQVAQDLNALNLEVGASVARADLPDAMITSQLTLTELPAGISSNVLLQRPDVLSAEHTLKAANADIGAARAAFFPSITLTADKGRESDGLSRLFQSGSGAWSFAPSISVPVFNGGSLRASLDEAKASHDIDLADYEKTIQTAFREVADALATRATVHEQLEALSNQVQADQRSYDLTKALYQQGSNSMLDVLTTQRTLYAAQQSLIALQLSDQTSSINLYGALGGGWLEWATEAKKSLPD